MEKREYMVAFMDIDPFNEIPIIFNDDNIMIKFQDGEKTYAYSDVFDIKIPSLALIKNVSFKLMHNSKLTKCSITLKDKKEREGLFAFLNEKADRAKSSEEYKIQLAKKKEEIEKEHIYKCNVCGNIFTYTMIDVEKNKQLKKDASFAEGASVFSGVFGTRYDYYEQQKKADNLNSQIKDFSKCPKCNSKNLVEIDPSGANSNSSNTNSTGNIDSIEEVKRFKELLDMGAITQEEFDKKKKELLNL